MPNLEGQPRIPEAAVDAMFPDRWSPRAFHEEVMTPAQVATLLEAARWAPSSANEQPWLFLYAVTPADRQRFAGALVEGNRIWAARAPLLMFLAGRRHWQAKPGQVNSTAGFDCGAAWMSLALQARKLGLYAHAMAGFERQAAHAMLDLPESDYEIWAAIAVGRQAAAELLPPHLQQRELPSARRPLATVGFEGRFRAAAPAA